MKRYAVFVGVNDYSNDITPLRCACKDAKTLSLKFAAAGFEIPELLLDNDAASGKILSVLDEIGKKIQPGDLLVFYFAGHGRELNNEHFLVCKDGYADPKRYMIGSLPLSAIVDSTGKEGVHRLFILDCCRDNLLAGRSTAYACETARSIALDSALKVKSGLIPPLILSSCSSGEKAFEDHSSGHGYFTKALLKTIENSRVQNFSTFSKVLNDNMAAPGAQHIAWNGNINDWDDVRLFDSWPQPAPQPAPRESITPQTVESAVLPKYSSKSAPKKKKGIITLSIIIAVLLVGGITTVTVKHFVEQKRIAERFAEELNTAKALGILFSYDGKKLIKCPENIDVQQIIIPPCVTTIGDWAFWDCKNLQSVTIPDSVTTIGDWAFDGCTNLQSVTIGNSVTSIGYAAFFMCPNLQSMTIPDSVTSIGKYAFDGCTSLQSVSIPRNCKVANNAFPYGCKVTRR